MKKKWGLIGAGGFFLGMYIVVASLQDNFNFPNYYYQYNVRLFLSGIPQVVLYSQFWKLLLLFPALVLFTAAAVKSGIRISFPAKINHRITVPAVLLAAAMILILSSQFLFHETEVTDDENTYDFQAQTLLAGRLVNPPPPVRISFSNVFIINDGYSWIGRYTMGHPAVIAFGMMLGNRYVGIIAVSIVTLLLVYLIGRELYEDKRIALLALCLGAISPFFYLVSSSRLSHTTSAFALALFMYFLLRARRTDKLPWAVFLSLLAGLSLGYAFNARAWTAFGWSLPFLVVMAKDAWKMSKFAVTKGMMVAAGFAVLFLLTLACNASVTGNPLQFPYSYYEPREHVGFGVFGHSPAFGIRNLAVSLTRLNSVLFGFPVSLFFVFAFLFAQKEFGDRLSYGILGSMAAAYIFFWTPGVSDLGPVYYYEMLIPLLLLSARGVFFLHEKFSACSERGRKIVPAFLVFSCLAALGTFIPERIVHISRLTDQIRRPYTAVQSAGVHHALVMIQPFVRSGWVFGYRNPSPQFTDDVVYCQYADSASNADVVRYFRDRNPYVLKYDTTAACYVVLPVNKKTGVPL